MDGNIICFSFLCIVGIIVDMSLSHNILDLDLNFSKVQEYSDHPSSPSLIHTDCKKVFHNKLTLCGGHISVKAQGKQGLTQI